MSNFWEDYSNLKGYFKKVTENLGWNSGPNGPTLDDYWRPIEEAYTAPDRFYHNLDHIREMLEWFDNHREVEGANIPLFNLVRYSIIMHDFYTGYPKAERDSAIHAVNYLFSNSHNMDMRELRYQMLHVFEMIEATAYHMDDVNRMGALMRNVHIKWIMDADLIRFLDPDWRKHADNIRKEYADHPDDKFNAGRAHVLQQFLKLSPFYFTLYDEDSTLAKGLVAEQIRDLGQ